MRFGTETGSVYELSDDGKLIRRANKNSEKRGDGEWQRIVGLPTPVVGFPAGMLLEPLSEYGPDDYGVENGAVTHRVTSAVAWVEVDS